MAKMLINTFVKHVGNKCYFFPSVDLIIRLAESKKIAMKKGCLKIGLDEEY